MQNLPIKKRFFGTDNDTGISLFLMGDVERDGERRFLVRLESEKGHLFNFYYPGGIAEILPGARKIYGDEKIDDIYEWLHWGVETKRDLAQCIDTVRLSKSLLLTPRPQSERRPIVPSNDAAIRASIYYGKQWYPLYTNPEFVATHSGLCQDEHGDHVYVYMEILNSYDYTYRYRKFVLRLPETEVVEILDVDEDEIFDAEAFMHWVVGWAIQVASEKANEIIDFTCCFCGASERRLVVAGEPAAEGCPKSNADGSHFWMDSRRLGDSLCSRLKQGTAPADEMDMYFIGICYAGGDDSPKYAEKIMQWYQRAADAGYESAMLAMGDAYAKGCGVAKNAENAENWYRKAAAMGNTEAMLILGLLYSDHENSFQDNAKALRWFRKSADGGNEVAMLALGDAYESGEITGYAPAKTAKWYRKLAKLQTLPPDFTVGGASDGVPWTGILTDVTSLNDSGSADGMARLGYPYEHGMAGVGKDMKKAVEWYKKAVEAGDKYSMFALGKAYELGRGVAQDWRKALEWYRKAAATGLMAFLEHSQKWRMMWATEVLSARFLLSEKQDDIVSSDAFS